MDSTLQELDLDLQALLSQSPEAIRAAYADLHAQDFADLIERADLAEAERLLLALDADDAANVLEYIDSDRQVELVERLGAKRAARIVEEMSADDAAELFGDLDDHVAEAVLAQMDPEDAAEVRALAKWEEGSVGALMTTEVLKVPVDMTVAAVIERVRQRAEEVETVSYVYVVGTGDVMVGVVSLRELILAHPDKPIADVMREEVICVLPTTDEDKAAKLIEHYDLVALPVVDEQRRLLGLVTVDDVMDFLAQQATSDFQRMGAVQPVETSYFDTGFWGYFVRRAPWLVALLLPEMLTGGAMSHFEDLIKKVTVLVLFVPLILSSGGNSGSQSASIIIRALALGEVVPRHAWLVFRREIGMGLLLGVTLGIVGMVRALLWGGGVDVTMVVGLSLICVVTVGTVLGSMLPLLLQKVGLNPADSSTPFIASISDILGILVYFSIARALLGLGG